MKSKGNEFNLDLKKDKLENVIKTTFLSLLAVLRNFYDYKVIINNLKSFKTLFRNIFESLKQINKISNIIIQQIFQQIYYIFLKFKNGQIDLEKEISDNNDLNKKNIKETIVPFIEGLIDMIYNTELFINYENESYINSLFQLTKSFIVNYIDDSDPKKILPFQPNFLYKILNLLKIIENQFVGDYTKRIKIIDSFFELLYHFFRMIIKEKDCLIYFRKLIPFSVINYENNLMISYRFLKFISGLLFEKYSLEKQEIEILLKYRKNLDEGGKEGKEKKLIEEIKSIIVCILLRSLFFNKNSKYLNIKIEPYLNSSHVLLNTISELNKISEKLIRYGISEDDEIKQNKNNPKNIGINSTNYMELFSNLFKIIINLFKMINKKDYNSTKKDVEENEPKVDIQQNLFSLLNKITKIISSDNVEEKNIYKIYCLINYTKFFHYIIFNEINIFQNSNKKVFIDNLVQIIKLDSKFYITNFDKMFKVKIGNNEYSKTMIEIIFEIYMNYIFNCKDSNECFVELSLKFDDIFYDNEFNKVGKYSVFYVNDYLRYILTLPEKKRLKKLQKDKTESILNKSKKIEMYYQNNFKIEEKFSFNFCTYFLQLILDNEEKIQNNQNLDKKYTEKLIEFMEQLFSNILKEHSSLFNIDKNFFLKQNSQDYNEKLNFIKKHSQPNEVKKFLISLKDKQGLKQEKIKENNDNNKENPPEQTEIEEQITENIFDFYLDYNPFQFPKDLSKIEFFDTFDENYIWNFKKELMNNTFGLFYMDEFFYNSDFCIIKKYYINKINKNPSNNSKQLNFPSIIKNYKNNFESSVFIKQFNNYMNSPYLQISHNYINDELNKKLKRKYSIKLIPKTFWYSETDKEIECEIIKNENTFFGKLIYNNDKNYFLFKEEKKVYTDEDGYKYLFLMDFFWNHDLKVEGDKIKFLKTKFNKNILILFDDIEEIIEMKVLHLWKGFEIFVKNGKSYFFNFLNTHEYETFKNEFLLKINKLKNCLRERNFLTKSLNICDNWKKGLISNYDYLLLLNRYSSRSFNDPSNYPVFPWLLNQYEKLESFNLNEKENLFSNLNEQMRDFKYPISLQTHKKREYAKEKYKEDIEEGIKFPAHTGVHYSTSAYVYFYLMRQQPYCNLLIKLQAYNLENTNRCLQSILNVQATRMKGADNRELIPEFFSKIEYFLNLNCDYYGILYFNSLNLDDCEMDLFSNKNNFELSNYVNFILQHKNLLNSKIIGDELNQWIDIIFGYNQLPPEKNRFDSCNIFPKSSYEQKINLEKKLKKNIEKERTQQQIISKIKVVISQLINFGMNPHQLFNTPHKKLKNENNENIIENEEKINQENINGIEIDDDFETQILGLHSENLSCTIKEKGIPIYFDINPTINKIFVYNENNHLLFYDSELFQGNNSNYFQIIDLKYAVNDPNIICIGENSIYQIKYGFSSFNNKLKYSSKDFKEEDNFIYHTYFYNEIKNKYSKKEKNNIDANKFKIIFCRQFDSTFQIHYLYVNKKDKNGAYERIFSFFCEDFVSSCCFVSNDTFLLGLKNGKLIYYKINLIITTKSGKKGKNKKEIDEEIKISLKKLKYIQCHYEKINSIDIDKRLGIIITSSDDNFIIIRKLYDFELLLPIKIKSKYQVLMTKVSPYNFLYVLCFNKQRNKKIIFGYTFSGIKFAKSNYGLFDNINIDKNGNIITLDNKKEILILSGSDLKIINNDELKALKKEKVINWLQYDNFFRRDIDKIRERKIITYFEEKEKEKEKEYNIKTMNLSDSNN